MEKVGRLLSEHGGDSPRVSVFVIRVTQTIFSRRGGVSPCGADGTESRPPYPSCELPLD